MKHFFGWKHRYNGKYKKTAAFTIDAAGFVYKHFDPKFKSQFFDSEELNNKTIVILLENYGWLKKNALGGTYVNYIGDIYKKEVFEKKWRDYFFWDKYEDQQIEVLSELILEICNKLNIKKDCLGHNVKFDEIKTFKGVVSKSNFDFIEIEKCNSIEELNIREQYFISLFEATDPEKGYNYSSGGKNFKASERLIEINRQAQIKYWSSIEARKAQSERKLKGVCSTKEHQLKMALVQGAKPFKVYKKDINEYIGTWINKAECARDLNIDSRKVCACLQGTRKSHKGYIFVAEKDA
jgi:hypothetical protein